MTVSIGCRIDLPIDQSPAIDILRSGQESSLEFRAIVYYRTHRRELRTAAACSMLPNRPLNADARSLKAEPDD